MNTLIKNGDVLVFTKKNFYSFIIRKITKSKWTHTANVYFITEYSDYMLIGEALFGGYEINKYKIKDIEKKIKKGKVLHRRIPENIESHYNYEMIEQFKAKPYGKLQVVLNAIKILFKKDINGDLNNTITCSESTALIVEEMSYGYIDIMQEFNATQDFIYPKHIAETKQLQTIWR